MLGGVVDKDSPKLFYKIQLDSQVKWITTLLLADKSTPPSHLIAFMEYLAACCGFKEVLLQQGPQPCS